MNRNYTLHLFTALLLGVLIGLLIRDLLTQEPPPRTPKPPKSRYRDNKIIDIYENAG
jgi:hypothetical protein